MPGFYLIACIGLIGLVVTLWIGVATAAEARDDKKIVHGVLLPFAAFISLNILLFGLASLTFQAPFFGPFCAILVVPFLLFVGFCVLVILMLNALLMLPRWKRRWTVWFIGSLIPVCALALEILFLVCFPYADLGP